MVSQQPIQPNETIVGVVPGVRILRNGMDNNYNNNDGYLASEDEDDVSVYTNDEENWEDASTETDLDSEMESTISDDDAESVQDDGFFIEHHLDEDENEGD